jgi:hypothetical protein
MAFELIGAITHWFEQHLWAVWLMTGLSLLTVLASFIVLPWAIVRVPADYFAHQRPPRTAWEKLHPAARIAIVLAKNLLGLILLLAGIIMALPLVPGPGVLTVLLGLALLDLPGKRRVERWLVARPSVFAALNKLRAKHNQVPLEAPQ